jgi:hypothetical protein
MARRRKKLTMLVTVSVPVDMSAAEARREVRYLITDQCNYAADFGDVKAVAVRAAWTPKDSA